MGMVVPLQDNLNSDLTYVPGVLLPNLSHSSLVQVLTQQRVDGTLPPCIHTVRRP